MRLLRPISFASLAFLAAVAIAACSSGTQPGWTYAPAPPATPSPAASGGGAPSAAAPSASEAAGGSAEPSASDAAGATLEVTAQNVAFDTRELEATAGQPFSIHFVNKDAGIPHDVAIRTQDGTEKFKGDLLNDVGEITYQVPALEAGTYTFICTIHPIPAMTGTLTVK